MAAGYQGRKGLIVGIAPARSLVRIDDVGKAVAFLALDGAKLMTVDTIYIDGGYHIID